MALLKKMVITRPGFAGELTADAYCRVATITGGKSGISAAIDASVDGEVIETAYVTYVPDISENAPNFIAQAYLAAKQMARFSDATDV